MRHGNKGRTLGRSYSHRKALMKNLATSLFTHGRIRTTVQKAKELQLVADQMITLAKRGDLHARRQAVTLVHDNKVITRLFAEIAPWYKERQGGYTRVMKIGPRPGDNALMAFIELVDRKPLGEIIVAVPNKKPFKNKGKKTPSAGSGQAVVGDKKPKAEKKAAAPKAKAAPKAAPKAKKKDDKA